MKVNNVKTLQKVYSIKEAYGLIPKVHIFKVREKIRQIIGTKNVWNVYAYINGGIEPKISHAIAFNLLFSEYGIEIQWGKEPPKVNPETIPD